MSSQLLRVWLFASLIIGMDLERELTKALEETRSYMISDDVLRLRDEHGSVVAELKAGSS